MNTIYDNTTFKPGEIGIIPDLSMKDYRDAKGLAQSDLSIFEQSPARFHRGERIEPTADMEFGTLFHTLLFTGNADFHTIPETYMGPESAKKDAPMVEKAWNWNAVFCKTWADSHQDKPMIARDGDNSASWLKAMTAKVEAHPLAKDLLSRLTPEVSIFARHPDDGLLLKGRLDGFIRGTKTIIVELKTTRDASTEAFSREIYKRQYHRKAAWYRLLCHQMKISPIEFWYIAIEKGLNPRVNVRQLAERAMDKGDFDNDDGLQLYRRCRHADFWPDMPDAPFPGDGPEIPMIDLPDFVYGDEDGNQDVITPGKPTMRLIYDKSGSDAAASAKVDKSHPRSIAGRWMASKRGVDMNAATPVCGGFGVRTKGVGAT